MKQIFLGLFIFSGVINFAQAQSSVKASVGVAVVSQYDNAFKITVEGKAAEAIWSGLEVPSVSLGEVAASVKDGKDVVCQMDWEGPSYTCILKNLFSVKTGELQK